MEYKISNEDEAFEYLQKILDGELNPHDVPMVFEGWPSLNVHINGDKFNSSLTPSLMKGFLELQKGINRSYCLVKYGTPNTKALTNQEREDLEIQVKVGQGSTTTSVDLQTMLTNIGSKVVDKMDPTTLAVTIVSLALIWAGRSTYAMYLENRRQTRESEVKNEETREMLATQKFMSQQETERTRILTKALADNIQIASLNNVATDAKSALIKELGASDKSTIQGIELEGETAAELTKNARRKSVDVAFNALFRIMLVDSSDPECFKVRLKNINTKDEFTATVQDYTVDSKFVKALQYGEWNKSPIQLVISAKTMDNEIRHAKILEAIVPDEGSN
ncbi:hypothetical protein OPW41_18280 [Vibrio europaeus]|uniref:hypothetical protein n=1 Tax=Vibrio europaeus TaxID=300876 RepID=UPI00233F2E2D|nr:hypothetical protein [Vibrio europaeus]MDC5753852.1 hypothetical protein [Vibrio europaeus]MDC5776764.1 hypothetical protein [Vibrio europaeus]MDC5796780.1 hypothetical protein [Vibrio europaeus]MDC5801777.1 hypothetical protein [Vibrio europaeus]MDC5815750.1 hypothetical protein [Vibrio europaeus]